MQSHRPRRAADWGAAAQSGGRRREAARRRGAGQVRRAQRRERRRRREEGARAAEPRPLPADSALGPCSLALFSFLSSRGKLEKQRN